MSVENVQERVKNIIVEQLGVEADQVKPEAQFVNDLGADSFPGHGGTHHGLGRRI